MLSMDESVELRAGPLSLTRSLMRMLGLAEGVDVEGALGVVGAWDCGDEEVRLGS